MSKDDKSSNIECSSNDCQKVSLNECIKDAKALTPQNIAHYYKNAVVEIHSEFVLLGTGLNGDLIVPSLSATGGTPLSPGNRTDVILEGNGFFIKDHYIVAPAQLVLLPPSLTSVVNRYPIFDPDNVQLGQIKDQMIRASRILVSVFNVNNKGCSFIYEADLIGVDGAGDIAVLAINFNRCWNLSGPCISDCHPYFTFGSSRASKDGEKVYLIGDYISNPFNRQLFNAVGAITDGILSDHRYLDYSGFMLAEAVLVNAPVYAFSTGLPILNCQGEVIGMQTTNLSGVLPRLPIPTGFNPSINQTEGFGYVAGPSEFFMRRIVKTIIKGLHKYNCHLEPICDPSGPYFRYRKAYTGIAYDVFDGVNYDTTTDFTSGTYASGQPRVRLTANGEFLNTPVCKEIIGIRVLGLAGLNPNDLDNIVNGTTYVPGGTGTAPLVASLPVTPFLNKLLPGDVITHINNTPIGDVDKQIPPSLITWRLRAGDYVTICYRRGGNALNTSDNSLVDGYDNLFTFTICLDSFPSVMDYPWYAINTFPLLINRGFNFPFNQVTNPQYPSIFGEGFFHPSF